MALASGSLRCGRQCVCCELYPEDGVPVPLDIYVVCNAKNQQLLRFAD